ncbi:MAG TPA: hypothetical protein VMN60_03345, partial [Longimicrobiales bacterium]|nr:hypothetical protein [Longimicrobiales bacterium]
LVYAAQRAGLRILSDDAVYVQLFPAPRVWATDGPVFLAADAVEWFPELAGLPIVTRANGRRKIALHVADAGAPLVCTGLCLLQRTGLARPRAAALTADDAVAELIAALSPGFDAFRDTIEPRLRALARGGAWRIELSEHPRAAVPLLRQLLDRVAAHAAS